MNNTQSKMPHTWLLLRGLLRESRHWGDFPQQLEQRLNCTVICSDIAGNGRRFKEESPTSIEAMMEQLRSDLRISELKQPSGIIALSMGAMIATRWLVKYPAEVAAVAMINTSMKPFSPFYHRLRPSIYLSFLGSYLRRDKLQQEKAILQTTSNMEHDQRAILKQWLQYAVECPVSGRNALNQLTAAARFSGPLKCGSTPVLLLSSRKDRLVNVLCSAAIANAWQCPLAVHPQAGHDLPLDDPDWVLSQLATWLSAIDMGTNISVSQPPIH